MAKEPPLDKHTPIVIQEWRGLYSRGMNDAAPLGYYIDCLNVVHGTEEVSTRDGVEIDISKPNIVRFFIYKRLNETQRYLILDSDGNFFDSLSPDTPLITNSAFVDFSACNYLNRAYITFHNRITGITGVNLYVYEGGGPGTLRLAAGSPPSSFTLQVTTSTTSGVVEAGTYLVAVAFESSSGFISAPGPEIFTVYVAPGDFAIDLDDIPIGPYGTIARRILISQGTQDYDGNQFSQELFFALRIGNNTDTSYTGLSFFNDDLTSSADYLFDIMPIIPAGVGLTVYNDRLIIWGVPGNEHNGYVSNQFQPEIINSISGYFICDPSEAGSGIRNCIEFRKQLYIVKNAGSYVSLDTDNDASTWSIDIVDPGIGCECFGISKVLGRKGVNVDRFFIADHPGLYIFESGIFQKPEMSWSIKSYWDRINSDFFNLVQVEHDTENSIVFVSIPLDDSEVISHILLADYSNALNKYGLIEPTKVRWSIWQFPGTVSCFTVDLADNGKTQFKYSNTTEGILIQNEGLLNDNDDTIESFIKTNLNNLIPNWQHHFSELAMRAIGSGDLEITLSGEDDQLITTRPVLTLSNTPGRELFRLINFTNEKMSVKLGLTQTANNYFTLFELTIMAKPMWKNHPA